MPLDPLTTFYQIAAVQGAVLAALLLFKRGHANTILALWLVATAIDMSSSALYTLELYRAVPHWIGITYGLPLLHGPFLYLYARSLMGERVRPPHLLHFAPFLAVKLYQLPFFLRSGTEKVVFLESFFRLEQVDYVVVELLMPIIGVIYVVVLFRYIGQRRKKHEHYHSDMHQVGFRWLRTALSVQLVIWLAALALLLSKIAGGEVLVARYIYALVAVWVFVVAYTGFLWPEVLGRPIGGTGDTGGTEGTSSRESAMPGDVMERIEWRLHEYMTHEEPWRDGDLTIKDVSNAIDESIHRISHCINRRYGRSFFTYTNSYRVRAAQQMLESPEFEDSSVLEIAYAVGFNSKSSFNAVFKELTEATPSVWRRRHKAGSPSSEF